MAELVTFVFICASFEFHAIDLARNSRCQLQGTCNSIRQEFVSSTCIFAFVLLFRLRCWGVVVGEPKVIVFHFLNLEIIIASKLTIQSYKTLPLFRLAASLLQYNCWP